MDNIVENEITRLPEQKVSKNGIFNSVKGLFKKRESKWNKLKRGTGNSGPQKIEQFREKVQSKEILNEINESTKEIVINKTELIWLLDNIHSNEQIIRKLKARMSHYEDEASGESTVNSAQIIDKLQAQIEELKEDKRLTQEDVRELKKLLNKTNIELENSREETSQKIKKIEGLTLDLELMQQAFDASESDYYTLAKNYQKQLLEIELSHDVVLNALKTGSPPRNTAVKNSSQKISK